MEIIWVRIPGTAAPKRKLGPQFSISKFAFQHDNVENHDLLLPDHDLLLPNHDLLLPNHDPSLHKDSVLGLFSM